MRPFQIIRVSKHEAAVEAGAVDESRFLAGGTNLIDLMKLDIETPKKLVDINSLELKGIDATPSGGLMIGALVTNTDLAYKPIVALKYPVISQAILSGASPQLRNVATVGGNILQRTRCPYFYDVEFACNKRSPQSGCSAMNGYNRSHAILGTSEHCIATHPSDMSVAFTALGAVVHTQSAGGPRKIPIQEFHRIPGTTPQLETVLKPGELITHVEIPAVSFSTRSCYIKVRDRASYEFALASAAVALDIQGGKIVEARIAFGGIGTKPWRSTPAEETLKGSYASEDNYRKAAETALAEAKPREHNGFKIELAKRTLIKALTTAAKI